MRRLAIAVVLCALLPVSAEAQDGTLGLGLGLSNQTLVLDEELGFVSSLTPTVYVPFVIGNGIMIEPGVGFFRAKRSEDDEFGDADYTLTAMRLGAGVFFMFATPERGRIYAGPRVGVIRMKSTADFGGEDFEESRMDLFFSAVLGGEFFLMPAFSLGGEAGLTYLSMGETEEEPEPDFEEEVEMSMLSLGTEFRVRWYIH